MVSTVGTGAAAGAGPVTRHNSTRADKGKDKENVDLDMGVSVEENASIAAARHQCIRHATNRRHSR